MADGPVAYEEPEPVGARAPPRVSATIHTAVSGDGHIPAALPAPAFVARLAALDSRYSRWLHEACLTGFTYACLRVFEFSGDGFFWLPVTVGFWLSPTAGSPRTRLFAVNLFVCLLFDLLVVGCVKCAVRRKRPHYNRGHYAVVAADSWSFPSGHSTRAVVIVVLVWLYSPLRVMAACGEPRVVAIAALWMVATACSRVILGRHYISDVLGGVAIGVLEALVAHLCLHVPLEVSEVQRGALLARVGVREGLFTGGRVGVD